MGFANFFRKLEIYFFLYKFELGGMVSILGRFGEPDC